MPWLTQWLSSPTMIATLPDRYFLVWFLGLVLQRSWYYHLGCLERCSLQLRYFGCLELWHLGPLHPSLRKWGFRWISRRIHGSFHFEALQLHQLEWLLLDNFLVGIERHYGDPRFLTVEIIFVLILVTSLVHLRSSRPLNSNWVNRSTHA